MPDYLARRLLVVLVGLQGYLVLRQTVPSLAVYLHVPAVVVATLCVLGALLVAVAELSEKLEPSG